MNDTRVMYDSFENSESFDASPSYSDLDSLEDENKIKKEKYRLITNIEALKDNLNPIPVTDSDSSNISLSNSNNSLPEFETFSDHTEETRSGSTTTHANNSLPEYDSFLFEIEPDQGRLISIDVSDNSNNTLLELPEFESFHFDPSFPRPPPEPPDIKISLIIETNAPVINNVDELNKDECFDPGGCEDTIFDPGIITFLFSYLEPVAFSMEVSCSKCCSPQGQMNAGIESSLRLGLNQQFLKPLVFGVVSQFTRASYPLFEISLGRSDILSSYRFTFIFA
ncbi:hypothetical protein Tco_1442468 [Tanacetum coccineum]